MNIILSVYLKILEINKVAPSMLEITTHKIMNFSLSTTSCLLTLKVTCILQKVLCFETIYIHWDISKAKPEYLIIITGKANVMDPLLCVSFYSSSLHASHLKMKSFMRFSSEISNFAIAKGLKVGGFIITQFCWAIVSLENLLSEKIRNSFTQPN